MSHEPVNPGGCNELAPLAIVLIALVLIILFLLGIDALLTGG